MKAMIDNALLLRHRKSSQLVSRMNRLMILRAIQIIRRKIATKTFIHVSVIKILLHKAADWQQQDYCNASFISCAVGDNN